jgi:hypothetical protein
MGWSITVGATRREIIKRRTRREENDSAVRECIANAVRGNNLWTVWEITRKPGGDKERFIGLDLLGTDGEGNWGYKDLEESTGPCEVNCPLSFLDLVPQAANEGWRERVRAYHARVGQKVAVGQTLRLVNASIPRVTVTSVRPLLGTYMGRTYRVARRFLAPPEEQGGEVSEQQART